METRILELSDMMSDKWGSDNKTENLHNRLKSFILQIDDADNDIREILLTLTEEFSYFSKANVNELLIHFNDQINNELQLKVDKTVFSKIEGVGASKSKMDSSNTMLEEFKICNEISGDFTHSLSALTKSALNRIDNIVIFDDIIGSGNTLIKFLTSHAEKIVTTGVKIYVFCLVILESALEQVNCFLERENINAEIKYYTIQPKAFKENYIFGGEANTKQQRFKDYKRFKKMHNILGYENSQALVAFYRNTPNNTLSAFWWLSDNWKGLFPRNNRRPDFMKKRTDKSSSAAYNLSKKETN
ncbi:hypothetical protein GCM10008983_09980 [Lentibacillus halophilus]|uniref:PRTase-CE domain-containing protein n=1 Tax=Lentibacillus halophilus TaxID=295065 RepID=A0ABN0Z626_9BACI